jgi:hypothetical protein
MCKDTSLNDHGYTFHLHVDKYMPHYNNAHNAQKIYRDKVSLL